MRDVYDGHASCGPVTGASRFLTGLVTCFVRTIDHKIDVYCGRLAAGDADRLRAPSRLAGPG
jgi:hypothetical protein